MKSNLRKKLVGIALIVLLLLVAAGYLGISFFYRNHFYNGTTINDIDVSNCSIEEVKSMVMSGTHGYVLTLFARDGVTDQIRGEEIDLAPIWDGSIDIILENQNGFSWILKEFSPDAYTSETMIGFDENKLRQKLASLSFMQEENQVAPVDASISDYIEGIGYELIPSKEGSSINGEILFAAVCSAVESLCESIELEATDCYERPLVLDDDDELNRRLTLLQDACKAKITYTVGDDVFDLDSDIYHEWFIIAEDGTVTLDTTQARSYVVELGHKYNTCYSTRNFETSYGQTVKITNSDYGWKVDYDAETEQVLEELSSGTVTTRDLNYLMVANSHNSPDYGNSYVEINLTAQHLFLYKDGELVVETDFVSGNVQRGNATPAGIFGLTYKTKDATLRGATYESHVDYWMPFNGNIGMHDATWRSKFGAAIYMRNGSHGCINLPHSAAETIYDAIYKDYPVIVYELAGTESDKGKAQIAAYDVMDLIDAIGEVTRDSEEAITAARTAYDALSQTGKDYVKNAATLTDAEKAFEKLVKASQEKGEDSDSSKKDNDKKDNDKKDNDKNKDTDKNKDKEDKQADKQKENDKKSSGDSEGANES